jgi:hypothetical protein
LATPTSVRARKERETPHLLTDLTKEKISSFKICGQTIKILKPQTFTYHVPICQSPIPPTTGPILAIRLSHLQAAEAAYAGRITSNRDFLIIREGVPLWEAEGSGFRGRTPATQTRAITLGAVLERSATSML